MARANLSVDPGVHAAWERATSDHAAAPFALSLAVEGSAVVLVDEFAGSAADHTLEKSFAHLLSVVGDGTAARLFLVALNPVEAATSKWTLVSFVPDLVHPKTKMLLAAARDDVKRALEGSRFTADFHATDKSELTFAAFTEWRTRDREGAMSEWEKAKERVVTESNAARGSSNAKVAGMAAVPFKVADEVIAAGRRLLPPSTALPSLAGFVLSPTPESPAVPEVADEGDTAPVPAAALPNADFAEIGVVGEAVVLLGECRTVGDTAAAVRAAVDAGVAKPAPAPPAGARLPLSPGGVSRGLASPASGLGARVEPRYFLLRLGYTATPAALPGLLYYCPEGTAPKLRMTYSTAKASLLEALAAAGVPLGRTLEARDEEELDSALAALHAAPPTVPAAVAGSGGGGGGGGDASSPLPGHSRTRSSPAAFAGMGGGFALPGMGHGPLRSPLTDTLGHSAEAEDTFAKPARPGRGPARVGVALPGMGSPK